VALLIALEIRRIVRHLRIRQDMLVKSWSRFRAREPFLETMFSRWRTVAFGDLALLPASAHEALDDFYEVLDDFRYYVKYTSDMPATLEEQYQLYWGRLSEVADEAVEALGFELLDEDEDDFEDDGSDASEQV
jgi:hypothetical protein